MHIGARHCGEAEATKLVLRVLGGDGGAARTEHLDAARPRHLAHGALEGFGPQPVAQADQRRNRVVEDLREALRGRIAGLHFAVRDLRAARQAGPQAQFEIGQPLEAHRPTKSQHGRRADVAALGDLHHRVGEPGARRREHVLRDLTFGSAQARHGGAHFFEQTAGAVRGGEVLLQHRRDPAQRGARRCDHIGRDARQPRCEAALLFEAFTKLRGLEEAQHLRHDAAADVQPADAPECQRQVARHRAEHRAKRGERAACDVVHRVRLCRGRDLGCTAPRWRVTGLRRKGFVDQLQARSRDQAFGRRMAETLVREVHRQQLISVLRRVRDVAALGAERHVVVLKRHQPRHTQAGAGAEHTEHTAGLRLATTDLDDLACLQPGQAHRQRGEVVDDQQRLQLQVATHRLDRKFPVVIGQLDPVAGDRVGERKRGVPHRRCAMLVEECACRRFEGFMAFDRHHVGGPEAPGRRLEREARVGGPDIGQQAQAVGVDHIVERWCRSR